MNIRLAAVALPGTRFKETYRPITVTTTDVLSNIFRTGWKELVRHLKKSLSYVIPLWVPE